ncbi:DinB family protein [Ktedonospora formicarum]|uniref:ClbS/DfsB family four-helix bundle protein n=1 Tax=Ktedonospora formicarum TaxID=2778364 RepID=A0A8J3I3K4_9CHLR|nr:DinB family protein [Ktedonospora formicarum]GHO46230.1 hypothetical protein KSX_43930 [Ktedonospora formicarum]
MAEVFSKLGLIQDIQREYQQFMELISSLSEEQLSTPGVNSPWSVKDNLAHLTTWQEYMLSRLKSIDSDREPPVPEEYHGTEDEINERIYQRNKARPVADVLADFERSYQEVITTLEATPEATLASPFPWSTSGNPAWEFVVGNTSEHYQEHGEYIRSSLV